MRAPLPTAVLAVALLGTPSEAPAHPMHAPPPPEDPQSSGRLEGPAMAPRLQELIEASRATGEAAHLEAAGRLLAAWADHPDPPSDIRLLRAAWSQQHHDFENALEDLDAILEQDPGHANARLQRAAVRLVRGDPRSAARDCAALSTAAASFAGNTCAAAAASLTGRPETALHLIEQALRRPPVGEPALLGWALTLRAEVLRRSGALKDSLAAYERALAEHRSVERSDPYLLVAYADTLLAAGRPQAVEALLSDAPRTDAILVRLALAARALGDDRRFLALRDELDRRFEADRRAGDDTHLREQAQHALWLHEDAARALPLARRNWAVQREPLDAHLLLDSATSADEPDAAVPVLSWMDDTGINDPALLRLRAALEASGPH